MPAILLPRRNYGQPHGRLDVDWGHPSTAGLVACVVGSDLANLARPNNVPTVVGNITAGAAGPGIGFSGAYQATNNYVKINRTSDLAYVSEVTFEALVTVRAFQTAVSPYISGVISQYHSNYGGTTQYYGPYLRFNQDGASGNATVPMFGVTYSNGSSVAAAFGQAQTVNTPIHMLGTYKSGSLDLYVNGARYTNAAASGNFDNSSSNFIALMSDYVGNSGVFAQNRCLNGVLHFARIYNRWLPPAEAAELSANPWQLFRAAPRRIYFDMGAGGAVPTLSALTASQITTSGARHSLTLTF